MPAPGPPASPAPPAPVCSEAELDRGWTQEGDSELGAPPPDMVTMCAPTPHARTSRWPQARGASCCLSHGSAGPAKASRAPTPRTCSLPSNEELTQNTTGDSGRKSSLCRAALEPRALQSPDTPGPPGEPCPPATLTVSCHGASPGRLCQPSLPGPRQDLWEL